MPAAFIHENIALSALKKINKVPKYIKANMDAFELGAQGPDLFFFYHILKFWDKNFEPNKLGETMHHSKTSNFFKSALNHAKKHGEAARAWLAGFATHYAADSTVHPYVYATTNNEDNTPNTTKHLLLETQFDTWYHRNVLKRQRIPRQAKCVNHLTDDQKRQIALTLSESCVDVFPETPLKYSEVYSCFNDMKNVINTLYSPYKVKHFIFSTIEKLVGKQNVIIRHAPAQKLPSYDFMNFKKDVWVNPWDTSIKSDKSFPELFDIAIEKSRVYLAAVIEYFEEDISFDKVIEILGNNSYSSGLPL